MDTGRCSFFARLLLVLAARMHRSLLPNFFACNGEVARTRYFRREAQGPWVKSGHDVSYDTDMVVWVGE